jgi:opacity protein-like surface antigen
MKLFVMKYKIIIRYLFLVVTTLFLTDTRCYAEGLSDKIYLKIELPVHTKINVNNEKIEGFDLSTLNQYAAGVGYVISPYLETELMFSQFEIHSEESTLNTYSNSVDRASGNDTNINKHDSDLFGFAYPSTPTSRAYCASSDRTFTSRKDLCRSYINDPSTTNYEYEGISGYSNSIKLKTFILSTKLNLIEEHKRITPYIFGGLGIVLGESKNTKFSKDIEGGSSTKTETTQRIGIEFGVGTKIKLFSKSNLEINAKYFDYGKYDLGQNASKGINGYKLSIGLTCLL